MYKWWVGCMGTFKTMFNWKFIKLGQCCIAISNSSILSFDIEKPATSLGQRCFKWGFKGNLSQQFNIIFTRPRASFGNCLLAFVCQAQKFKANPQPSGQGSGQGMFRWYRGGCSGGRGVLVGGWAQDICPKVCHIWSVLGGAVENTVSGVSGPKKSHVWAKCISAKKENCISATLEKTT